ncbi:hypothetical protein G6L37_09765 [Agrobacterium rubi]|uniref:hypothetical protein n=1 Tax=Agrobacterium rubi TaxID=28099 RepID=UPI0015718240|nr:hypothetical protein [Agrobacterium rubi]NTF06448.1 hypothetical protein [Agrobacterium rubi]NTF18690.1 hypothetical protein [Agrobacterium rubi]NTF25653.1 hypothetical protein [Agrobacterium rubi]
MSGALAKYLKDFSQFVPPEAPSAFDLDMPVSSFESDFFAEPEIVVDLEEEKRKAFAEGEVAAAQQAKETHENELAALRLAHAAEIEAIKTRYEDEIATHLATSVISMKQTIAADVEQVCLRLFGMVMERDFAEKAAADVSAKILQEIEGGFAGTIKITGPDALLSHIREALGDVDNQVDYDVSTDIDVKVQMDNSVLMTRLSEFFQSVRGLADE